MLGNEHSCAGDSIDENLEFNDEFNDELLFDCDNEKWEEYFNENEILNIKQIDIEPLNSDGVDTPAKAFLKFLPFEVFELIAYQSNLYKFQKECLKGNNF